VSGDKRTTLQIQPPNFAIQTDPVDDTTITINLIPHFDLSRTGCSKDCYFACLNEPSIANGFGIGYGVC